MEKKMTRRNFLKLAGASALVVGLSACDNEGTGGSGDLR